VRIRSAAALALLLLAFLPRHAAAEPAFGEPGWVAPGYGNAAWQQAAVDTGKLGADTPGPRVAEPDHDPASETALRAPFRLLFLPLRLIARGSESLIGVVAPLIDPHGAHERPPLWSLEPIVTPDPSLGLGVTRRLDPWGNSRIQVNAIYGWQDRRRARFIYSSARDSALKGLTAVASYNFRPNATFYGLGNHSTLGEKSYWLREAGDANASFRFGRAVRREVRLLAGLSSISARSGFNGPAGTERVEDVFTPEEAPFLQRASVVVSYGLAGEISRLDDIRTPHAGVHLKGQAEQVASIDGSHLDYRRFHFEARAYVPAFSSHQLFAFRAFHAWVDPSGDSEAIPYYRLPESDGDLRFNGYQPHRFSDRHYVLGTAEYRWWLSSKLYTLLAVDVGEVASQASRLTWADHRESYGLGFRYGYSDRLVGRLDMAQGSEGLVLNLTLESTF
jgi:hypothetical protein